MFLYGAILLFVLLVLTLLTGLHVIKVKMTTHRKLAWLVLILAVVHASLGIKNWMGW